MTPMEYHSELTKVLNELDRINAENRRLHILIEQLQRRVAEARPYMTAIDERRRTNGTQTLDYTYDVK